MTLEEFITRSQLVHENYDYSLVKYVNSHTPVTIICNKHGEFSIRPYAHINQKQGCRKCGLEKRKNPLQKTNDKFIEEAISKWGDLYDYSETKYTNKKTKIIYKCKIHGNMEQMPTLHIRSGCSLCNGRGINKHTLETFIEKANQVHNNLYDYSKVQFSSVVDKIIIICKKHGEFNQSVKNHINLKNGCPKCVADLITSLAEQEIIDLIKSKYNGEIIQSDRKILFPKEIDILIPELKIGIEYNGNYWHTEEKVGKSHHVKKTNRAESKGYNLLHIFEHEWENKKEIIKSILMSKIGFNNKIFARKTKIINIDESTKNKFLEKTHMKGKDNSSIYFGLEYNDNLLACMTFCKLNNNNFDYELTRYSSELNYNVIGGASKLLNHFRRNHNGSIVSYANRRWSNGNMYKSIGFEFNGNLEPSYFYYNLKNKSIKDKDFSNFEIMKNNGYEKIWDVGLSEWIIK